METNYKILGGDGQEYGPVTLGQLKTWMSEGRILRDSKIWRSDQAGWQPAGDFAELDFGMGTAAATATIANPPLSNPALLQEEAKLTKQIKSGAGWFYWIAGLSLVNTVMIMTGSDRTFIIGLGITQIVDAFAHGLSSGAGTAVAVGFDIIVVGFLIALGIFCSKRHKWAFIVGMILYGLDGLIFVLIQGWLSVAFHAFALFCIFGGFRANGKLAALERGEAV